MSTASLVDRLSPDQRQVFFSVLEWLESGCPGGLLTLGGYAGTGKTTILGALSKELRERGLTSYATYTGRASSILGRKLRAGGIETTNKVLREKDDGFNARYHLDEDDDDILETAFCGTLHQLVYKPVVNKSTGELLGFRERSRLDREYDLIVIDEASMVGDTMLALIRRFDVPILAVGDHGQLPPVLDGGALMKSPALRLERIHRQAEGSPIIRLAAHVRQGGRLRDFADSGGAVVFGRQGSFADVARRAYNEAASRLDVGVICWRNATRIRLNTEARRVLRLPDDRIVAGEVVICLRNSPPIYNGMRGVLEGDAKDGSAEWLLDADVAFPDEGLPTEREEMCYPQFNRERPFERLEELAAIGVDVGHMGEAGRLYDFGYAMTCHKAQGSQFSHAIVYVDRPERPEDDDWRRWAYTAITRGAEKVTVLL